MKLAILFSGGKDSALAMHKVMGEHEVVCLISVFSRNPESYMFHTPNIEITRVQAEAIGLPLVEKTTQGVKEEELDDLTEVIEKVKREYGIEGIVTGAIASVYQASRIQKICDALDLECINPLWQVAPEKIVEEVIALGYEVIISGVFAYPLDESWLGRKIDDDVLGELVLLNKKLRVSPSGEGGEIETTVLDAPFFKKKIIVTDSKNNWQRDSGTYDIIDVELVEKQ